LALQSHFKLTDEQLLAMSSTGTILAAVAPEVKEKVKVALRKYGLSAYFLGQFTENRERTLIRKGKESVYPQAVDDPYTQILSGK
jgi:hydrogenase maturation factor